LATDRFAWFGTTGSKSRLNFLDCCAPAMANYAINAEALAYMRSRALPPGPVIRPTRRARRQALRRSGGVARASRPTWHYALKVLPDPVPIATERRTLGQRPRPMAC